MAKATKPAAKPTPKPGAKGTTKPTNKGVTKPPAKPKSQTKAELVDALAGKLQTTKTHAATVFDEVIELLKSSLEANKVVTVPQFGTFAVQDLKARKGRNPRTNQEIEIPASKTIRFKPSVGLKKAYNN